MNQSQFEQSEMDLINLAKLLASYRATLYEHHVPPETADLLTVELQNFLLENGIYFDSAEVEE